MATNLGGLDEVPVPGSRSSGWISGFRWRASKTRRGPAGAGAPAASTVELDAVNRLGTSITCTVSVFPIAGSDDTSVLLIMETPDGVERRQLARLAECGRIRVADTVGSDQSRRPIVTTDSAVWVRDTRWSLACLRRMAKAASAPMFRCGHEHALGLLNDDPALERFLQLLDPLAVGEALVGVDQIARPPSSANAPITFRSNSSHGRGDVETSVSTPRTLVAVIGIAATALMPAALGRGGVRRPIPGRGLRRSSTTTLRPTVAASVVGPPSVESTRRSKLGTS